MSASVGIEQAAPHTFKGRVSFWAAIVQLLVSLVGLPDQAITLWMAGSADGVSLLKYSLALIAVVLWFIWGVCDRNWRLYAPQIPGVVFMVLIVSEIVYYQYF